MFPRVEGFHLILDFLDFIPPVVQMMAFHSDIYLPGEVYALYTFDRITDTAEIDVITISRSDLSLFCVHQCHAIRMFMMS